MLEKLKIEEDAVVQFYLWRSKQIYKLHKYKCTLDS